MVSLKAKDKQPLKDNPKVDDGVMICCFLFDPTIVLEDEIIEPWSPEGCHRTTRAYDSLLPKGWAYHGHFLLCPTCEERWAAKWRPGRTDIDLSAMMSGDE